MKFASQSENHHVLTRGVGKRSKGSHVPPSVGIVSQQLVRGKFGGIFCFFNGKNNMVEIRSVLSMLRVANVT